ncbi:MAG TPA: NAD(P)/FAD-dependent oxidoreductase, partial [Spongiibacteraceae bacterium]|nr:NAD(P)/FAD-dependent oxidoreductase [Spongiibacteraceae bacterium]
MRTFDQAEIRAALAGADIRVLLMVLFHLTGERRWLEQPFQPKRDIRLFADISAGLGDELQQQVRDAVLEQLLAGVTTPKIGQPDDDLLVEMMGLFSGEQVSKEYVPLVLEEMRFTSRDTVTEIKPAASAPQDFRVLIIGAG